MEVAIGDVAPSCRLLTSVDGRASNLLALLRAGCMGLALRRATLGHVRRPVAPEPEKSCAEGVAPAG